MCADDCPSFPHPPVSSPASLFLPSYRVLIDQSMILLNLIPSSLLEEEKSQKCVCVCVCVLVRRQQKEQGKERGISCHGVNYSVSGQECSYPFTS